MGVPNFANNPTNKLPTIPESCQNAKKRPVYKPMYFPREHLVIKSACAIHSRAAPNPRITALAIMSGARLKPDTRTKRA